MSKIARIAPSFHEKVWGSTGLAPWFAEPEANIGEVCFETEGRLPLIKFLFTAERLSIQVHPDDAYAREHEDSSGKTEMWHILRAAPGAKVGIGFRQSVSAEELRSSSEDGTIEGLVSWVHVRPGDTLFVPAGTVHAIGAGIVLCEIQQHSDVTYRIFDYGRGRELHLDKALDVAQLGTSIGRSALPVRCPFFYTERIQSHDEVRIEAVKSPSAIIVLDGEGMLQDEPFLAGEVWEVPVGEAVQLRGRGTVLRTYIP